MQSVPDAEEERLPEVMIRLIELTSIYCLLFASLKETASLATPLHVQMYKRYSQ